MTSTLKVDTIQGRASTTSLDLSAVTNLQMPSGHVIQTQYMMSTTRTAISSTSYSATALQKSIAPKFANSLIYIQIMTGHNTETSGRVIDFTIQRGSFTGSSAENVHEITAGGVTGLASDARLNLEKNHAGRHEGSTFISFVDVAHNSTESRSYHLLAKSNDGNAVEVPASSTQLQVMVIQEISQ